MISICYSRFIQMSENGVTQNPACCIIIFPVIIIPVDYSWFMVVLLIGPVPRWIIPRRLGPGEDLPSRLRQLVDESTESKTMDLCSELLVFRWHFIVVKAASSDMNDGHHWGLFFSALDGNISEVQISGMILPLLKRTKLIKEVLP